MIYFALPGKTVEIRIYGPSLIGLTITVCTALNDGGIDVGLYNSYGMLSVGFIILVSSILWVAIVHFANTFQDNKKLATSSR